MNLKGKRFLTFPDCAPPEIAGWMDPADTRRAKHRPDDLHLAVTGREE